MGLAYATLQNISKSGQPPIPVQFNPTNRHRPRRVVRQLQVPGLRTPLLQFVRGEAQTLSLGCSSTAPTNGELRPDDTVEGRLKALRQFVEIDPELRPAVCFFHWNEVKFTGVVTSFKEKCSLFDQSGKVLRARVTLSLKSCEAVEVQQRDIKAGSPVGPMSASCAKARRWRRFPPRSTATALWRAGRANGIDRPRFVSRAHRAEVPAL
jgi:hypothetical protein